MKSYKLQPNAASLFPSLRDVGYSLETAISDLIDNSISARARNVRILVKPEEEIPSMAIIDDGIGMSEEKLIEAMRHGSDVATSRGKNDLGRFGLGLKTASLSQCRRLTVVSRHNNKTSAATWDLDYVLSKNEWLLQILDENEYENKPFMDFLGGEGTMVLWENMDRLTEQGVGKSNKKIIQGKLADAMNHLSLVFHRYLNSRISDKKINIYINRSQIEGYDPFCRKNDATQLLREDVIRLGENEITIQPYILPHHSKMTPKELKQFTEKQNDIYDDQGVYIYREKRLMAWGSWFRLATKSEMTKNARVRIDFPSALDEFWAIDIKKSRASFPFQVKQEIERIIGQITSQSAIVQTGRIKISESKNPEALWLRIVERDRIRFKLNKNSNLVKSFSDTLGVEHRRQLNQVMSIIEHTAPIGSIYSDYSKSGDGFVNRCEWSLDEVRLRLTKLAGILYSPARNNFDALRKALVDTWMFREHDAIIEEIVEEKLNGQK